MARQRSPGGGQELEGVCALCKTYAKLQKSHIIPEFFYEPAYDDKHRLVEVTAGRSGARFLQKGIYEALLCRDCEQLLNTNYEHPMSAAWPRMMPKEMERDSHILIADDYRVFRLFHLSILWRASVARGESWTQVSLGPRHEERLRRMILDGTQPPIASYPLLGNVFLEPGTRRPCFGWVMPPTINRIGSSRIYSFLYGGCSWHTVVSSHPIVDKANPFVFSARGQLGMAVHDASKLADFDLALQVNFKL